MTSNFMKRVSSYVYIGLSCVDVNMCTVIYPHLCRCDSVAMVTMMEIDVYLYRSCGLGALSERRDATRRDTTAPRQWTIVAHRRLLPTRLTNHRRAQMRLIFTIHTIRKLLQ